jgi:mono/diheme cytochrome c family protein
MKRTTSLARPIAFASVLGFAFITSSFAQNAPDAKQVAAGEQIYADYCSSCHGEGLNNTSGGVTFDLRRLRPEDHGRFRNSVLDGKRQMPPWRGALDDAQIDAIWAYMRKTLDR